MDLKPDAPPIDEWMAAFKKCDKCEAKDKRIAELEQLARMLYLLAKHCPSDAIPNDFDFVTPLEQAELLPGRGE